MSPVLNSVFFINRVRVFWRQVRLFSKVSPSVESGFFSSPGFVLVRVRVRVRVRSGFRSMPSLPIVASGITSSADATMQGPVASALTHLSGETNFIQVTPSPDPGLPKFNSINVPIDANVSTKIKAKIWAHEFIDFNVLLSSGAGDTRCHLSVSSQNGSALPTLSLEPYHLKSRKLLPILGHGLRLSKFLWGCTLLNIPWRPLH